MPTDIDGLTGCYYERIEKDYPDLISELKIDLEKDYPDLISELKIDLEKQNQIKKSKEKINKQDKPEYIKDEVEILKVVEQEISKKPEIINELKLNPENMNQSLGLIMQATDGKLDPKIIKSILHKMINKGL